MPGDRVIGVGEHSVNIDQLVDLQWRLGVAISSDSCRNLNAPYIALSLTLAEPSGKRRTHSFEMTVAEFHLFSGLMALDHMQLPVVVRAAILLWESRVWVKTFIRNFTIS